MGFIRVGIRRLRAGLRGEAADAPFLERPRAPAITPREEAESLRRWHAASQPGRAGMAAGGFAALAALAAGLHGRFGPEPATPAESGPELAARLDVGGLGVPLGDGPDWQAPAREEAVVEDARAAGATLAGPFPASFGTPVAFPEPPPLSDGFKVAPAVAAVPAEAPRAPVVPAAAEGSQQAPLEAGGRPEIVATVLLDAAPVRATANEAPPEPATAGWMEVALAWPGPAPGSEAAAARQDAPAQPPARAEAPVRSDPAEARADPDPAEAIRTTEPPPGLGQQAEAEPPRLPPGLAGPDPAPPGPAQRAETAPEPAALPPGLADDAGALPPGLAKRAETAPEQIALPPGLADDAGALPPGLAKRAEAALPPGLADDAGVLPPGLAKRDEAAPEQAAGPPGLGDHASALPPGLAKRAEVDDVSPAPSLVAIADDLPPGLAKRVEAEAELPPGLTRPADELPPGLARQPDRVAEDPLDLAFLPAAQGHGHGHHDAIL